MLREFSHRRIGVLFAIDWLGTLAIFLCAALIRAQVGSLPSWATSLLGFFRITADEAWDPNVAPGDIYRPLPPAWVQAWISRTRQRRRWRSGHLFQSWSYESDFGDLP